MRKLATGLLQVRKNKGAKIAPKGTLAFTAANIKLDYV